MQAQKQWSVFFLCCYCVLVQSALITHAGCTVIKAKVNITFSSKLWDLPVSGTANKNVGHFLEIRDLGNDRLFLLLAPISSV